MRDSQLLYKKVAQKIGKTETLYALRNGQKKIKSRFLKPDLICSQIQKLMSKRHNICSRKTMLLYVQSMTFPGPHRHNKHLLKRKEFH